MKMRRGVVCQETEGARHGAALRHRAVADTGLKD